MEFCRRVVLLLCVVMLSACSSGKLVQAYQGKELPKAQLGALTAGENVSLLSVNGDRVPDYLLSGISVDYGLKPGKNVVLFQYESVWSVSRKGEDGARSKLVESVPREVVIDVKAGDRLSFRYAEASNIREAQRLADSFEADVVNHKGQVVASSGDVTPTVEELPVAAASVTGSTSSVSPGAGLPAIEAMKVLWADLPAQEKKAFLKWAFQ